MKLAPLVFTALLAAGIVDRAISPTNSRAAATRGVAAYQRGDVKEAAAAFREAAELRPSPETAFGLGTAQIAADEPVEGAAVLEEAVKDPSFRRDALFNRGTGALRAQAFDHAVRDFEEVLRISPGYAPARRNLEIALRRRDGAQQQASEDQRDQQQPQEPQEQPQGEQREGDEQGSAEALLRSVEQQEREELARMRRARGASPRIGW
jgi:tetratricopeptide (TPR) repeat protein